MSTSIRHERGTGTFLQGVALREWVSQQHYRGTQFIPVTFDGEPQGQVSIEVFHCPRDYKLSTEDGEALEHGWYWWPCMPGCLPDGEPGGPYSSAKAALEEASQEYNQ